MEGTATETAVVSVQKSHCQSERLLRVRAGSRDAKRWRGCEE